MVVWIFIALVAVALFALAWWTSGRSRGRAPSVAARASAEAGPMTHYRPSGSVPPTTPGPG